MSDDPVTQNDAAQPESSSVPTPSTGSSPRVRRFRIRRRSGKTIWQTLLRPEVLFLFGTLQALFPYAKWKLYGMNPNYPSAVVTYLPLYFWVYGWFAFVIGAALAPRPRNPRRLELPSGVEIGIPFTIAVAAAMVLLLRVTRAYGGVPLLAFIRGSLTIDAVNDANGLTAFGELGLLSLLLFSLNGLVLCLLLLDKPTFVRRMAVLFGFAIEAFGTLFAGKRQGFVISLFFFVVGLTLATGNPFRALIRFFRVPAAKLLSRTAVVVIPCVLVVLLSVLGSVRTQASGNPQQRYSFWMAYLEYPLMNLEEQTYEAGLGPRIFSPIQILRNLVPHRLFFRSDGSEIFPTILSFRIEPTSQAGFYGDLQWYVGFWGAMLFTALAGFVASLSFQRAKSSLFFLLTYSQMAWTLIACHSYNHFLMLVFLPLPVAAFACLGIYTNLLAHKRRRFSWGSTAAAPLLNRQHRVGR